MSKHEDTILNQLLSKIDKLGQKEYGLVLAIAILLFALDCINGSKSFKIPIPITFIFVIIAYIPFWINKKVNNIIQRETQKISTQYDINAKIDINITTMRSAKEIDKNIEKEEKAVPQPDNQTSVFMPKN